MAVVVLDVLIALLVVVVRPAALATEAAAAGRGSLYLPPKGKDEKGGTLVVCKFDKLTATLTKRPGGQLKKLVGFAGTSAMVGSTWINWLVTFTTTASTFLLPRLPCLGLLVGRENTVFKKIHDRGPAFERSLLSPAMPEK